MRSGDTLVVTKLDRLARSVPDARDIADNLRTREGMTVARAKGNRALALFIGVTS